MDERQLEYEHRRRLWRLEIEFPAPADLIWLATQPVPEPIVVLQPCQSLVETEEE